VVVVVRKEKRKKSRRRGIESLKSSGKALARGRWKKAGGTKVTIQ